MKINNKGFAISTILYGILSLTIIVLMLIFALMKSNKDMNQDLVDEVEKNLNSCVYEEVHLDLCYKGLPTSVSSCSTEIQSYNDCLNR